MSIPFLADNDFNGRILKGLRHRLPAVDVVRLQDVNLADAPDPVVLEWAARQSRIVVTHDVRTMRGQAYARIAAGLPMPGLFIADNSASAIGRVIDHLVLIDQCLQMVEWDNRVEFLPL